MRQTKVYRTLAAKLTFDVEALACASYDKLKLIGHPAIDDLPMTSKDENNIDFAQSIESTDALNANFYGRFQFPWIPAAFDTPTDPAFETVMLNQSLGSWDQSLIPAKPKIWVAGCGTNQAIFTALRFPNATILGTDLSTTSLETSTITARQLGISNVEFSRESINHATFEHEFDYVICTGVIHHNADPKASLAKLSKALKPSGILELMVYNRYHRIETTAFQKAIRILAGTATEANFEVEMQIAQAIIAGFKMPNNMARFLENYKECPESRLADSLLQPIEYSFTIRSLESLAASCNLELLAPCINQFDIGSRNFTWNLEFDDSSVQTLYDSLSDSHRWQVSNYLMLERSPMLWFYLQRTDSNRQRKSEKQLCEEFLEQKFMKSNTKKKVFIKSDDGNYVLSDRLRPYPGLHIDNLCSKIVALIANQPATRLRDILEQLGVEAKFSLTNRLRLYLTTNAFPFLVARPEGHLNVI
ncbi:MAG TPA: class I SAM-dependent methyltransferase [Pyrinomonadaceae bacterium]|nr:class I SAM-dependent methyltransferase [Pyrinomonadaceae bacterium]